MQVMSQVVCLTTGQSGTIIAFTSAGLVTIDWDVPAGHLPAYSDRPLADLRLL